MRAAEWFSVAIGNVQGAIAAGHNDAKKIEARLNLERLDQILQTSGVPLVLHGDSGIKAKEEFLEVAKNRAKVTER